MQRFSRTPFAASLMLVLASGMTTGSFAADKQYGPGVTDTEIKIGQTTAYSGPASAYGNLLSKTQVLYVRMINERGGINGRKISLISLDDGYKPAEDHRPNPQTRGTGQCLRHL
jgi:ABC-type branched-subunit amino acid transport system substrate-binding protein